MDLKRFERLYEEHAQSLYGFLAYRTGDGVLAEDLVADTFERALRSRPGFDPLHGTEKGWLYSIALNLVRDHARRDLAAQRAHAKAEAAAVPPADPSSELELVHERDAMMRAFGELTPEEREAVALRFGPDLTLREIARVVGVRPKAVEGRLYRGLAKLREVLGGED